MKKNYYLNIPNYLFIALLMLSTLVNAQRVNNSALIPVKGKILVKPVDGISKQEFTNTISEFGAHVINYNSFINLYVLSVPDGSEERTVAALSKDVKIKFAERDMLCPMDVVPNDPQYSNQWYHSTIQTPAAWDLSKATGVRIGILDTGIDTNQVDLKSKIIATWDATGTSSNPSNAYDVEGHGTWVAGVAAASTDNGTDIAGTGWNASLIIVRVADASGYATYSTIANGITFAANNGARVVNASFSGVFSSSSISAAAQYLRTTTEGLVVCSAGNSTASDDGTNNPDVITVSATNIYDALSSFSNFGTQIDVAAPGESIMTTNLGGGTASVSGTSFSSPMTAGVISLIMAADPSLTAAQVENILKTTATDLGTSGYDTLYGYGRINAYAAVQSAVGCGVVLSSTSSLGICSGGSATLSATGGTGGYTWSPATGLSATSGNAVTANPSATTTYTVSDNGGCVKQIKLTVVPPLVISANSSSSVICSGTSATITAAGATTYTWSPSTGLNTTTGTTVNTNTTSSVTYTVTGTTNGCSAQSATLITVNPGAPPVVSVTSTSTTLCKGATAALTASGGLSYTWAPKATLKDSTGTTVVAHPVSTTTYTVTGSNANCSAEATVTITVGGTAPTITVSPTSTSVCSGSSVKLTASGPGGSSYTWSPSTGLSASTGSSVMASPSVTTSYIVKGTKGTCFNTDTALVTVCPTGIADAVSNTDLLRVYPNPATGNLNIELVNKDGKASEIFLYNTLGEVLVHITSPLEKITLDISDKPSGIYFISVLRNNEPAGHTKVLLEK